MAAAVRGPARVMVTSGGRARAAAAAQAAEEASRRQVIYGRATGFGANRDVAVAAADSAGHGLRLLRSHSSGTGPLLPAEPSLAMLLVRANQIAAGGSGVQPGVLHPLAVCLNRGLFPPVPRYGAIGTADMTALAVTALCLLGEREWRQAPGTGGRRPGPVPQARFALTAADALPFISSSAATLGEAALACHDLRVLLRAALPVAALAHLAVDASPETYAEPVQNARPHRGQRQAAAVMRRVLEGCEVPGRPLHDTVAFCALPQVHGAAEDALAHAVLVVETELNARAESPLIDVSSGIAWHNGNFHGGYACLALDALRAALFQAAALSAARLSALAEPARTGLTPFLAAGPAGSSGIMALEYVAQSAVADIRRLAAPAALGVAVVSRGIEEHAGFSSQSAWASTETAGAYRAVLSCELVAAVRALRMRGITPGGRVGTALGLAAGQLSADMLDRPLDTDLAAAGRLLPRLAAIATA